MRVEKRKTPWKQGDFLPEGPGAGGGGTAVVGGDGAAASGDGGGAGGDDGGGDHGDRDVRVRAGTFLLFS